MQLGQLHAQLACVAGSGAFSGAGLGLLPVRSLRRPLPLGGPLWEAQASFVSKFFIALVWLLLWLLSFHVL